MRADAIVHNQLMMAQSIELIANHLEQSVGFQLTPVKFVGLPLAPMRGMIACVTDSSLATWGAVIAGGGANTVLAFYDGVHWVVK